MGEFLRERLPDAVAYFEAEGLEMKGSGAWRTARCDFHGGSDSLRINVESGGWVCMNCGAKGGDVLAYQSQMYGQDFIEAAKSLGAWDDSANLGRRGLSKPLPFSARMALEVLRLDALVCAVAACNVAEGVVLNEKDRSDLIAAAGRIDGLACALSRKGGAA